MFRIATFNLHQGLRRWSERRHLILEQLAELRPDVLCLNEVAIPRDTGRWLWQEACNLGLDYAYVQQHKTGSFSEEEGQAILSRFRVLESDVLDFQSRGRVAQVVRLQVEGSVVDVYLTHLHHRPQEDGLRQYQVQRLLAWLDRRDEPDARVVCGDFNGIARMASIQLMQERFQATQSLPTFPTPLREKDWDRWDSGNPRPRTREFRPLTVCLDYIWHQPSLAVLAGGPCFDRPDPKDSTLWPSDHVGVWADFEVVPQQA